MQVNVEFAVNNTTHGSAKQTPSKLFFGVNQRGTVIDQLTEFLETKTENDIIRYLDQIRNKASGEIHKSQEKNLNDFLKKM